MSGYGQKPKLTNLLRGIQPTASVFNTNPTNLERCTDGNISTATGAGSKAVTGADTIGELIFNIGSIKTMMVSGKIELWSSANAMNVMVLSSEDGTNWRAATNSILTITVSSEGYPKDSFFALVTGRYIRFRFYTSGTATGNVKIWQLFAHELGV